MWYVITGAAGLLLGIGLLIWAIVERKRRYEAEKQALKYAAKVERLDLQNRTLVTAIESLREAEDRYGDQVSVLRKTISSLRERLISCQDHQTITEWLESEMEDNNV